MQRLFSPLEASIFSRWTGIRNRIRDGSAAHVCRVIACALALALLALSTMPALGQATKPTAKDVADLASDQPAIARRAYNNIRTYFQNEDLGVLERSDTGRALLPELQKHVSQSDLHLTSAVPAIFIAGDIATEESITFLNSLRTHEQVSVRFTAITALGNTLGSAKGDGAPAIGERQMLQVVDWLGDSVEKDTSANALRAALEALYKGNEVDLGGFERIPGAALSKLATSASVRLQQLAGNGPDDLSIVESCVSVGQRLRNLMLTNRELPESTIKEFAGLGGDILSALDRMVRVKAFPMTTSPIRDRANAAATLGVNLIFVAHNAIGRGGPLQQPDLGAEVVKGTSQGDTAFDRSFRELVTNVLSNPREPFQFRSERFLR